MKTRLRDQVVVITGGSSGIGRETALACARGGARVVLAARGRTALDTVIAELQREGALAHGVVADVSDATQVEHLAQEAVDRFGRIDTWVNNAAVITYGTLEQLTASEIERVIAVDLVGAIHGARAALSHMVTRGRGTIINLASVLGVRAFPLLSTYSAAKAGLFAFTEALRVELARDHPGIGVTVILPSSIDTPLYAHARSKRGVRPKPYPPVYDPAIVARAVAFAAEHRRRQIYVGGAGRLLIALDRISPALVDRYLLQGDRAFRDMLSDRSDDGRDNLFASLDEPPASRGGARGVHSRSAYTAALMHPAVVAASLVAVATIAGVVWRSTRR